MKTPTRYTTLQDYVRVLRRSRLILLVSVVLFAFGAWLLTAGEKPMYSSSVTLGFNDVAAQTDDLLGQVSGQSSTATNREQLNSTTLVRPAIVALVAKQLHRPITDPQLTSGVTAGISLTSGFLVITVQNPSPAMAQALAVAYGRAVQTEESDYWHGQFATAEASLRQQLRTPAIRRNPVVQSTYLSHLAQLQFDSKVATPVTLVSSAVLPTTPVSPHPVRDAVLGAALGLLIGIILAFARDALDRRLRSSEEITAELGWPIIGHVREGSLGRVGFVPDHPGKQVEEVDLEAFRILRQNIQLLNLDSPPRSVVVTSAKPEEGKSTVAASLACASALSGTLTLLIECDLRRPTLAAKLGIPDAPGLTEYLLGLASPAEILRMVRLGPAASATGTASANGAGPPAANGNGNGTVTVTEPAAVPVPAAAAQPQGSPAVPRPALGFSALAGAGRTVPPPAHVLDATLVVIPAGNRTGYPAELLGSGKLRTLLAEVTAAYEMVVIDTPPVLPVADALAIAPQTDATLLCVRGSQTSGDDLQAVKQALGRLPQRPMGVVMTGYRAGAEVDFGYYSYQYQYK